MCDKTTELLTRHQHGDPIMYNHLFTETLQKVHRKRGKNEREDPVSVLGVSSLKSWSWTAIMISDALVIRWRRVVSRTWDPSPQARLWIV